LSIVAVFDASYLSIFHEVAMTWIIEMMSVKLEATLLL